MTQMSQLCEETLIREENVCDIMGLRCVTDPYLGADVEMCRITKCTETHICIRAKLFELSSRLVCRVEKLHQP